jgi:hypothetical protein
MSLNYIHVARGLRDVVQSNVLQFVSNDWNKKVK